MNTLYQAQLSPFPALFPFIFATALGNRKLYHCHFTYEEIDTASFKWLSQGHMAGKWDLKEGWLTPKTTSKYLFYFSKTRGSQFPVAESSHCWSCESRENARQFSCADISVDAAGRHVEQGQWPWYHTLQTRGKALTTATAPDSPCFLGHLSSCWEDDHRVSTAGRMTPVYQDRSQSSRFQK